MLQAKPISLIYEWKKQQAINQLHHMCSRLCSFPPAMPRFFIENYSFPGDVFLDNFSGKGTAPLEAALLNRKSIGNDVSPEAYVLTYAKLNPIQYKLFEQKLLSLREQMGFIKTVKTTASNIKVFYNPSTLKQILEIRELLRDDKNKESMFIKGVMLGILHGSTRISLSLQCSHSYSMSPNYVKKYARKNNLIRPRRDVIDCLLKRGQQLLLNNNVNHTGLALNNDSRKLDIPDEHVDISVFSPPYLRVQTYAYDNWLRLWFLGFDYKHINKKIMQSGSMINYMSFMEETLKELYRVMKYDSNCFIVVGDVPVKTYNGIKIIKIAEYLKKFSEKIGFQSKGILRDTIPEFKKSMLTSSSCGIKTERILHITK